MTRSSKVIILIAILFFCATLITSGYIGARFGWGLAQNYWSGSQEGYDKWNLALKEAIGLVNFYSFKGHDRWVYYQIFPGVDDGYFIDLGSADGERSSNSKFFETIGWTGMCIDPFPTNMSGRTCEMFEEVVDSQAGRKIQFQSPGKFEGGILDYAGAWITENHRRNTVELTTTTLDAILERANAPEFIHYLSIDIEGAEVEALKGLSFSKYKIGVLTIEHNANQINQEQIRNILKSNGYRLAKAIHDQDWYLLEDLAAWTK